MNLNYMQYVYAVYKEKGFSKAAQKLYVAQPWLSTAVRKVEQELQVPLFDRSTNPITLTEAGRCYISYAEKILGLQNEMEESLKELSSRVNTNVRIGSSMFFCTYVLPRILEDFRARYPETTISMTEGSTSDMMEQLEKGSLDFVLEAEKSSSPNIISSVWASEQIVLAVPRDLKINHRLSEYRYSFEELLAENFDMPAKPAVPLNFFRDESFLLLKKDNDIYERGLALCQHAGFNPKVSLYLEQMMTAYYLVCEGAGVTFLRSTIPQYVIPSDRIVFYRIGGAEAGRYIYLSRLRKKTSPMQQHLIDYLTEHTLIPNH